MAKVGVRHVVAAPLNGSGYGSGMIVGKAVAINVSVDAPEAVLYADDVIAESIREFNSGTISLNTDDLTYEAQKMLLGHTVTDDILTANVNDVAPYVGVGFCGAVVRNNVKKYRAIWYSKCQFSEPSDENTTKGENTEFSTPTIEGTIMPGAGGQWKTEKLCDTAEEAIAWLDSKANIVGGGTDD